MAKLSPRLIASDAQLRSKFFALKTDADVANLLELPVHQLRFILYEGRARYPYRHFTIAKKSGGDRSIDAPHTTIRILQRKLLRVLRLVVRPHKSAHGFVDERSIRSNAVPHSGKTQVLNLDLKDFFPSVNFGRVQHLFMSVPFNVGYGAATVLAQLCCKDGQLPQGAPTSPMISNMICYRLDVQLKRLAADHKWFYTRYADDITFSTWTRPLPAAIATRSADGLSITVGDELRAIIHANWFEVNDAKVRLQSRETRQVVTGLSVNYFPNVSREFVRETRAMIANLRLHGEASSQEKLDLKYSSRNRKAPNIKSVVRGRLDFISMVRGVQDPVYLKLRAQAQDVVDDLVGLTQYATVKHREVKRPNLTTWRDDLAHSIVQLHVVTRSGDEAIGTGWIMAPGVIATAAHCLVERDEADWRRMAATAYMSDGTEIPLRTENYRIHRDYSPLRGVDAALILTGHARILTGRVLPVFATPPVVGEQVGALGFPSIMSEAPDLTVTSGIIQSVPADGYGTRWLSVSTELHGGMSGGPVIAANGGVVGVVVGAMAAMPAGTEDGKLRSPENELSHRRVLPAEYFRQLFDQTVAEEGPLWPVATTSEEEAEQVAPSAGR